MQRERNERHPRAAPARGAARASTQPILPLPPPVRSSTRGGAQRIIRRHPQLSSCGQPAVAWLCHDYNEYAKWREKLFCFFLLIPTLILAESDQALGEEEEEEKEEQGPRRNRGSLSRAHATGGLCHVPTQCSGHHVGVYRASTRRRRRAVAGTYDICARTRTRRGKKRLRTPADLL